MSELEDYNKEINEIKAKIITLSVTLGVLEGVITTDNKSPANGLSGLDSTCIYFAHSVGLSPDELKGLVLDEYRDYKLINLDSNNCESEMKNDVSATDYLPMEFPIEDSNEFEIRAIALMTRMGLVADDSQSTLNNLSPLEQLIFFLLKPKDQSEFAEYKKKVRAAYIDLGGGYHISPGEFGTQIKLDFD